MAATQGHDLAPHSAILTLSGEIHERLPNGSYHPSPRDKILQRIEIRADNLPLAREKVRELIELLIERMDASGVVRRDV